MEKDLAEMKAKQHEILTCVQRLTIAVESLQMSVNSKSIDIAVIGGLNFKTNQYLSSVERFNLFNQTWTQLPRLKIARYASAAVMFENQVFVCGGGAGNDPDTPLDPLDSVEVLDLNDNPPEWHEFSVNIPIKVTGHTCVVHGNRLLIIGGQMKSGEISDTIYELLLVPPYSSKLLCHMKKKRAYHGVELFDDKVLIAGGDGAETDVEIFDIARNECVEMSPLPSPLSSMGTVRRGDTMLLIGGMKNNETSNKII
ncbi:kelch 40, partial [Paramuricea clavata]